MTRSSSQHVERVEQAFEPPIDGPKRVGRPVGPVARKRHRGLEEFVILRLTIGSQADLAQAIENYGVPCTSSAVSLWEAGASSPSDARVRAMALIFGVKVSTMRSFFTDKDGAELARDLLPVVLKGTHA